MVVTRGSRRRDQVPTPTCLFGVALSVYVILVPLGCIEGMPEEVALFQLSRRTTALSTQNGNMPQVEIIIINQMSYIKEIQLNEFGFFASPALRFFDWVRAELRIKFRLLLQMRNNCKDSVIGKVPLAPVVRPLQPAVVCSLTERSQEPFAAHQAGRQQSSNLGHST